MPSGRPWFGDSSLIPALSYSFCPPLFFIFAFVCEHLSSCYPAQIIAGSCVPSQTANPGFFTGGFERETRWSTSVVWGEIRAVMGCGCSRAQVAACCIQSRLKEILSKRVTASIVRLARLDQGNDLFRERFFGCFVKSVPFDIGGFYLSVQSISTDCGGAVGGDHVEIILHRSSSDSLNPLRFWPCGGRKGS